MSCYIVLLLALCKGIALLLPINTLVSLMLYCSLSYAYVPVS